MGEGCVRVWRGELKLGVGGWWWRCHDDGDVVVVVVVLVSVRAR